MLALVGDAATADDTENESSDNEDEGDVSNLLLSLIFIENVGEFAVKAEVHVESVVIVVIDDPSSSSSAFVVIFFWPLRLLLSKLGLLVAGPLPALGLALTSLAFIPNACFGLDRKNNIGPFIFFLLPLGRIFCEGSSFGRVAICN